MNSCDEQAFTKLYNAYATDLCKILQYKYGTQLNPVDKVQDAFTKLWEHCKKVLPSQAKGYLYTIANNMMLNAIKHQKVVLKYAQLQPQEYDFESPEFKMRKTQFLEAYQKALEALKPEQREAFLWEILYLPQILPLHL